MAEAEDDIVALERMSIHALPDLEHVIRNGWRWRHAFGVTNRANSLTPVSRDAEPVLAALAHFRALTREKGLRAAVRVSPLAPPDTEAALLGLGFVERDAAISMVGDPQAFAAADPAVRLDEASDPVWRGAYASAAGRFDQREQDILADIHAKIAFPKAFARIERDGAVVAHGYAVVEDGWVSLHEIGVTPAARRHGLARAICGALADWGLAHGARRCWLQVRPGNTAARTLYRSMGFADRYAARYLAEPSDLRSP